MARRHDPAGVVLLGGTLLVTAAWWALALAPVADPPPWLAAARAVCFGATPTGLPDTYGWLLLVLAPGSMLAGIFAVWGRDIALALRWRGQRWGARTATVVAALALSAGLVWAGARVAEGLAIAKTDYGPETAERLPAGYPRLDRPLPEFRLVDQHGEVVTADTLRGRVTLLTFAFAHCATVCPVIVRTARSATARLGGTAPDLLIVTLDPWRDTPSRLAQIHRDWELPAAARVLSGDVAAVTAALDAFGVPWRRDAATGDVAHPPLVYLVDREGRIAYGFNNPSPEWLVEAATRLAGEAPSPAVAAR